MTQAAAACGPLSLTQLLSLLYQAPRSLAQEEGGSKEVLSAGSKEQEMRPSLVAQVSSTAPDFAVSHNH